MRETRISNTHNLSFTCNSTIPYCNPFDLSNIRGRVRGCTCVRLRGPAPTRLKWCGEAQLSAPSDDRKTYGLNFFAGTFRNFWPEVTFDPWHYCVKKFSPHIHIWPVDLRSVLEQWFSIACNESIARGVIVLTVPVPYSSTPIEVPGREPFAAF